MPGRRNRFVRLLPLPAPWLTLRNHMTVPEITMLTSKTPESKGPRHRLVSKGAGLSAPLVAVVLLFSAASGRAEVAQVLDSVDVYGFDTHPVPRARLLEMVGFRNPPPPATELLEIGSATKLVACQRAADQGLYCIDGDFVRYWPKTDVLVPPPPATGGVIPDVDLINCRDPALGGDQNPKKPSPCTGITVDLNGAIWLAIRKANSHSLFKVTERVGASCAGGAVALAQPLQDLPNTDDTPADSLQQVPHLCAREWAFGRPELIDLTMVDGEIAGNFAPGPGSLGLEARTAVAFFPDAIVNGAPAEPVPVADGKAWGLGPKDKLTSVAFLQIAPTAGLPYQNFVVVTVTNGAVLATKADGTGTPFQVFQMPLCESGASPQPSAIRVRAESERVYVSDRACKEVLALTWSNVASGSFALQSVTKLKTELETVTVSPDGLSVAPGIGINLRDCGIGKSCPLVADGDNNAFVAAELRDVVIEGVPSGAVVFQVKGIPDCRWWPEATRPAVCSSGVIRCGDAGQDSGSQCVGKGPEELYLDIAPLLPSEVTLQFTSPTFPELLVPPPWKGQDLNLGPADEPTIDLFFFITEPGVQFRDTFLLSFDVADLTGGLNLGCGGATSDQPDLNWDAGLTGSETIKTVSGGEFGHIGMLVTKGCFNPTSKGGARLSYYAYTMEKVEGGDGVYANLVRSLFDDLRQAQQQTACVSVDPEGSPATLPPLDATSCAALDTRWDNADPKLVSCIQGSTFPRQSQAVNNCQSFLSQLANYRTTVTEAIRNGPDPANRIGELEQRVDVLDYVFRQHFENSIPPDGFRDPVCAAANCTP